ncbi:hypothetical protein Agabi119p4_9351 [Agaricus bisporus var. burnettii]|uniref:Uncharacterized protein n=1 Tax=Agaricus bisporus var. burnettii TaxID=192524 RepID=A0A8H7C4E6_AGABI|nr:hypothetical protein Agabi119p4_9351 [Agaricus bisporus var. burnettii]
MLTSDLLYFIAFFRDLLLRRRPRLNQTHKNGTRPVPDKTCGTSTRTLDTLLEEELYSMHFKAYTPTTRAQRRHALNSIPKELKTALEDISEEAFPHKSLDFPPPLLPTPSSPSKSPCESPPLMTSSLPSSPDSHNAALPLTPSSSVDELPLPSPALKLKRRGAVKPLVFNKLDRFSLPVESDSEDSDSEWYTREFSTLLSLNSPSQPMPLPAAHRDSIFVAPFDSPFSSLPGSSLGLRHGKFSDANASTPPVPPKFRSAKCTKTLSITAPRRPPPRMSIPDDACSAFSLSYYTDDILDAQPSPLGTCSPVSARMAVREDLDDAVEFPGEFDIQVDHPMMLPFSLPGSPIDPEVDIMKGLEDLCMQEASVLPLSPSMNLGVGFILEEADYGRGAGLNSEIVTPRIIFTSPPPSPTSHEFCSSLPPSSPAAMPSVSPPPRPRRCSTISDLSSISFPPSPCIPLHDLPAEESTHDADFDERKFGLKSKWSSSSISSLYEEHSFPSSKFPSASKLKMYFQGQHKRNTNTSPLPGIVSPKSPRPSSSLMKGKRKWMKGTKRGKGEDNVLENEVLVIGYNNLPSPITSFYSPFSPSASPRSSYEGTSISPVSSPRHSHDMRDMSLVPSLSHSSRHRGHIKSSSQDSTTSDSGSYSSCASATSSSSSSNGTGLRRKPLLSEMFLRNDA